MSGYGYRGSWLVIWIIFYNSMKTKPRGGTPIIPVIISVIVLVVLPGEGQETKGFDIADTNDDGKVSPQEFERFMMETLYAFVDVDRNKKVTFAEWKAANPGADESKFNVPDKNGDKIVTPEEARAHFRREGTMDDLFKKIDTNKDGYLVRSEVIAFKKSINAQSGLARIQNISIASARQ